MTASNEVYVCICLDREGHILHVTKEGRTLPAVSSPPGRTTLGRTDLEGCRKVTLVKYIEVIWCTEDEPGPGTPPCCYRDENGNLVCECD